MSAREPITAWVDGIGLLAPGIGDWATGRALLRGDAPYTPAPTALPAP